MSKEREQLRLFVQQSDETSLVFKIKDKLAAYLTADIQTLKSEMLNDPNHIEYSKMDEAVILLDPKKFRFLSYLFLEADALLIAGKSGTLCLLSELSFKTDSSEEEIEELESKVYQRVEEALKLRKAAKRKAENTKRLGRSDVTVAQDPDFAWIVEVVFVILEANPKHPHLQNFLTRLANQTEVYKNIHIKFLQNFENESFIKAFPFLLIAAKRWQIKVNDNFLDSELVKISELQLENFRSLNNLKISFSDKVAGQLHLIHGWNGSGKSTIAEAFELVFTGQSSRLENFKNNIKSNKLSLDEMIGKKASIIVKIKNDYKENEYNWKFDIDSEVKSLRKFHLDQQYMNNLIFSSSSERALIFLKSFYPEDDQKISSYQKARTTLVRTEEEISSCLGWDGWGEADVRKTREAEVEAMALWPRECDLLPLKGPNWIQLAELEVLARKWLDLEELIEQWKRLSRQENASQPEMDYLILERLSQCLRNVEQDRTFLLDLDRALSSLTRLNAGWSVENRGGFVWLETLKLWMEAHARTKIMRTLSELAVSMQTAKSLRWQAAQTSADEYLQNLDDGGENLVSRLEELERLEQERDGLLMQMMSKAHDSKETVVEGPKVSEFFQHALDRMGQMLGYPELGRKVQEARMGHKQVAYEDLQIGRPEWANELIEKLTKLKGTLDKVKKLNKLREWHRAPALCAEWLAARKYMRSEEKNIQELLNNYINANEMRSALTELLALFNPSSLNYSDLDYKMSEALEQLDLRVSETPGNPVGLPAELIWNMAELNLLSIVMFFLNSYRKYSVKDWTEGLKSIESSDRDWEAGTGLSFLLLDDPLQNMDELTVVNLARGMARMQLAGLLPKGILMLFHGQGNINRFREELQECACYQLDWMVPVTSNGSREIKAVQEIQKKRPSLKDFLELVEG